MTKDEALNLAIEALQKNIWCDDNCNCSDRQAITAIKEALTQLEPVACDCDSPSWCKQYKKCNRTMLALKPYVAQRTWVEIDGDDWIKALEMADFDQVAAFEFFENKLKELNT